MLSNVNWILKKFSVISTKLKSLHNKFPHIFAYCIKFYSFSFWIELKNFRALWLHNPVSWFNTVSVQVFWKRGISETWPWCIEIFHNLIIWPNVIKKDALLNESFFFCVVVDKNLLAHAKTPLNSRLTMWQY